MKKLFVLILALALLCSSALADHGTVQQWYDTLKDLDDVRYLEDANEAIQLLLFERYASSSEGVKVPAGKYLVGTDIPVGTYRIEYHGPEMSFASFLAQNEKTFFGFTTTLGITGGSEIGKIELTEGTNVEISDNDLYFYTYTGLFH